MYIILAGGNGYGAKDFASVWQREDKILMHCLLFLYLPPAAMGLFEIYKKYSGWSGQLLHLKARTDEISMSRGATANKRAARLSGGIWERPH